MLTELTCALSNKDSFSTVVNLGGSFKEFQQFCPQVISHVYLGEKICIIFGGNTNGNKLPWLDLGVGYVYEQHKVVNSNNSYYTIKTYLHY